MSDTSERRLQRILNEHDFYTVRTPGSGTGLTDPDTDTRHDHPDVVAIRDADNRPGSDVLVVEDKHTADYPVYVDPDQYDALTAVARAAGAYPCFAVQVKNTNYPHDFHVLPVDDRTETGNHVLREGGEQVSLRGLVDRAKRRIATD